MAFGRVALREFVLANPLYAGAVVSAWPVTAGGAKDTSRRAVLYTGLVGAASMVNPQKLDSDGMWPAAPYVAEPVILEISGPHVASHDSAVIEPNVFGSVQETAADGDTTPSVAAVSYLRLANTAPTNITTFDGAQPRQRLVVEHTNGNTTLVHNAAVLRLQGSVNFTPAANTMQEFIHDGALWRELSRVTP